MPQSARGVPKIRPSVSILGVPKVTSICFYFGPLPQLLLSCYGRRPRRDAGGAVGPQLARGALNIACLARCSTRARFNKPPTTQLPAANHNTTGAVSTYGFLTQLRKMADEAPAPDRSGSLQFFAPYVPPTSLYNPTQAVGRYGYLTQLRKEAERSQAPDRSERR